MTDNTPRELIKLVLDKIEELGPAKAQEYFDVSAGTISAWRSLKTFPSIVAAQKVWDDTLAAQAPEIWGGNGKEDLHLMLPCYETFEPFTVIALIKCMKLYGMDRIKVLPKTRTLIDEARNDLAHKWLLTKGEFAITIDADNVPSCGSPALMKKMGFNYPDSKMVRNAIERLMSHPKEYTIVGALYKDRRSGNRVQCEHGFRSTEDNQRLLGLFDGKTQSDALEETGWVGMGMVRFHRSVFMDIAAEAKVGGKLPELARSPGREQDPIGFFGRTNDQRGEDVSFCRRAARVGHRTFIDHGALVGHVGRRVF